MSNHHTSQASIKTFNRLSRKEQTTLSVGIIAFVALIPVCDLLSLFRIKDIPYVIVGSLIFSALGSCLLVLLVTIHHHFKNK